MRCRYLMIAVFALVLAGCESKDSAAEKKKEAPPRAEAEKPQLKAPKLTTFLMFEGKAEEAMNLYVSLFPDAKVTKLKRHPDGPAKDKVYQGSFVLSGREFMCYDSPAPHGFTFTPAISIFVECESKERIDALAKKLGEGGQVFMPLDAYPFSKRFTWLQDKFGVSWQLKYD